MRRKLARGRRCRMTIVAALAESVLKWCGMGLYWLRLHPVVIWLNRRSPRVLLYHRCDERENDFTEGIVRNTTPGVFRRHLEFLCRYYKVISVAALESGDVPDRAVVITFDDGYRSVYENAFPVLREKGLPATVYVVTDVVDNRAMVWVHELNWFMRNHGEIATPVLRRFLESPCPSGVNECLGRVRASYERGLVEDLLNALRAAVAVDTQTLYTEARLYLRSEEIADMAQHGITFGSHTATHPILTRLSPKEQCEEFVRARGALAEWPGASGSLAYPFGDFDEVTRELVTQTGHSSAAKVGGVNRPLDIMSVARVPVRASSKASLFAELEVVAPTKAWAKRILG